MQRRKFVIGVGSLAAVGASPAVANHNNNRRRSEAEPVDLESGDVVAKTADPSQANFEEEFTYWRVDHGIVYTESEYREPARTGPDVYHLGGGDYESFWFGVSGPDDDGVQHEINHKGQVAFYMLEEGTGEWKSLKVQFNGKGELIHVNGVEPQ
jgi:hypothetical protein